MENELTTKLAAKTETSKLRAYCGRIGAMRPKPSAMTNAALTSTQISRGMGVFGSRGARGVVAPPRFCCMCPP